MPSDLIRGWEPVRVKKTRQKKSVGRTVAPLNKASVASRSVASAIPLYANGMRIGLARRFL